MSSELIYPYHTLYFTSAYHFSSNMDVFRYLPGLIFSPRTIFRQLCYVAMLQFTLSAVVSVHSLGRKIWGRFFKHSITGKREFLKFRLRQAASFADYMLIASEYDGATNASKFLRTSFNFFSRASYRILNSFPQHLWDITCGDATRYPGFTTSEVSLNVALISKISLTVLP